MKTKRTTTQMQGPLHNNPSLRAKDAELWQINASIQWYETTLARYPLFMHGKEIVAPSRWFENLAQLKAERANRIGKK